MPPEIGFIFGAFVALTGAMAVSWIRQRRELRRLRTHVDEQLRAGGQGEERLGRIEQAVDAIALEVERLSAAQRFTAHVLGDRSPAPAPAPAVRSGNTPH